MTCFNIKKFTISLHFFLFIVYLIIFAAGWIANHMMFKYHMHENPDKMRELVEQLKQ